MRIGFIALSAVVTIACVIYVVVAARAPVASPPVAPPSANADEPAHANANANATANANVNANADAKPNANADPPAPPADEPVSAGELAARAIDRFDGADYDGARELALRCLAADRTRSQCQSVLANSYARRGQYDEGHAHFVQCLKDDPGNEHCMAAMTAYHLAHGERADARRVLDQLQSGHGDSLTAHLAAGDFARATGDRDGECTHYKAACDLGNHFACKRWQGACARRHEDE